MRLPWVSPKRLGFVVAAIAVVGLVASCALALQERARTRHIQRAAGLLASPGEQDRLTGAQMLVAFADPRGERLLLGALADPRDSVGGAAAQHLGQVGSATALLPVCACLNDTSAEVREKARTALDEIALRALRPVQRSHASRRPKPAYASRFPTELFLDRRDECAAYLAPRVPSDVGALTDALEALRRVGRGVGKRVPVSIGVVEATAVERLATSADPKAFDPLLSFAMLTRDHGLRGAALQRLRTSSPPSLVPAVQALARLHEEASPEAPPLTDGPEPERHAPGQPTFVSPDALPPPAPELHCLDESKWRPFTDGLAAAGKTRLLLRALYTYDDIGMNRRADAAWQTIRAVARRQGGETFASYLDDPDTEVRAKAAYVVGNVHYRPAVGRLLKCLDDEDDHVRACAAMALGRIRDPRAIAPLIGMLKDPVEGVRWAADSGLVEIGEPAVRPAIKAVFASRYPWLRDSGGQPDYDAILREVGQNADSYVQCAEEPVVPGMRVVLVAGLLRYGTKMSAMGLAGSNDPILMEAADKWAAAHGYAITRYMVP